MIVCEMPGVVFINQAFKKSEKIMLVSYQAEKIQHLTVSGKDRIVDVQKIGTVSSGLMDFFSKDEIVDVQTLIRRTHHPAGRIERIFVFTNLCQIEAIQQDFHSSV